MEITSVWQAVQAIGFMLIVSGIWFWAGMQYARNQDIKAFTKILSKMIEDREELVRKLQKLMEGKWL